MYDNVQLTRCCFPFITRFESSVRNALVRKEFRMLKNVRDEEISFAEVASVSPE